jgi:hypothetical protein
MILTDSVSSIMQATPSDYLVHFEDIPLVYGIEWTERAIKRVTV